MTLTITFPDGSTKDYADGITPLEIAKGISEGLAREVVVAKVDGELKDAFLPLKNDASLELLKFDDPEGKEVFWHSTTHIMAQAVKRLFPDAKPTIGPTVEEGFFYDFDVKEPFTIDDLENIEAEMKKIVKENFEVTREDIPIKKAKELFKGNEFKLEIIGEIDEASIYTQGEFVDLCRGPHVPRTGMVKAFKLTKIAGAYWRGDAKNKQLSRIYGISFPDKKQLKGYLEKIEQAKQRDHRKLGVELDLYSFHEESPGAPFFHPKGTVIYNELKKYIQDEYVKRGYEEVVTPLLYDKSLWETSGHWGHYKENMFLLEIDGKEFSLKPMNCPSHCLLYKTSAKSYRDLPLRIADFAPLHRNELRGVLQGLTRVRKFSQDDSHTFCTHEQIEQELLDLIEFTTFILKDTFDFPFHVELSTRPEKFMGEKKVWDDAEDALKSALDKKGLDFVINEGDGAFYGPKIDFHMKDALGRSWQLSTVQLDFSMPKSFELTYMGEDGKDHTPVMIHKALLGSIERFIGILVEHTAGKFPLWLSPVQAVIIPVTDDFRDYGVKVFGKMQSAGLRVDLDDRSESVSKKVRDAQLGRVNFILVVGEKEAGKNTVTVRTRDGDVIGARDTDEFITELQEKIEKREL